VAPELSLESCFWSGVTQNLVTENPRDLNPNIHIEGVFCNVAKTAKGFGSSAERDKSDFTWDFADFDIPED
jgi:hypothetical protein